MRAPIVTPPFRVGASLRPQRDGRIDAHRPPCRRVAAGERDGGEDDQCKQQKPGIVRPHPEQQRRGSQAAASARAIPMTAPAASTTPVSTRINRAMAERPAPSAMRTPISFARRVTV